MIKATCIDTHCHLKLSVHALASCYVLDFHVITNCNRVNSFRKTSFFHSWKILKFKGYDGWLTWLTKRCSPRLSYHPCHNSNKIWITDKPKRVLRLNIPLTCVPNLLHWNLIRHIFFQHRIWKWQIGCEAWWYLIAVYVWIWLFFNSYGFSLPEKDCWYIFHVLYDTPDFSEIS